MISDKALTTIEYFKVLERVSSYSVLNTSKDVLMNTAPTSNVEQAEYLLKQTEEAYKCLYVYGVGYVPFFYDITEDLLRVERGGIMNLKEILKVKSLLVSSKTVKNAILAINDENIKIVKLIAENIYIDNDLEKEINDKVLSEDTLSDRASEKLYSIRRSIANINAKIKDKLNQYVKSGYNKYLQDAVITMRGDRYVLPVKAEYRKVVKGLIHDQSSTGSTLFIEPEQIVELNNDLKTELINEKNEINAILRQFSSKIAAISSLLRYNIQNLTDIDVFYAKAQYAFKTKSSKPIINDLGLIDIKRGRHPLIDATSVVPVSVNFGFNYNFLLITGPNTGGKTVTLKLVGLFSAMAASGLYVPADDETKLSVFDDIFCDIGDEQSIEQSLSTFSSHMKNVIEVVNKVNDRSLVLFDELGAGTDPDEGSALALAVINALLDCGAKGIITTHYSRLKEFAYEHKLIENASMEFDSVSLKPLYKLNIGTPGSSNALIIAEKLGLNPKIVEKAKGYLSDDKISFENVLQKAEESRLKAETLNVKLEEIEKEKSIELQKIKTDREEIEKEKEKIKQNARSETRRLVNERLSEADDLILELKSLVKKANIGTEDLFYGRSLKNKIENSSYIENDSVDISSEYIPLKADIKDGDVVYSISLAREAVINRLMKNKKEAEIIVGNAKIIRPLSDLKSIDKVQKPIVKRVSVSKSKIVPSGTAEINILGKTVQEGVEEVVKLIDSAIVSNFAEVKIIHGFGTGKLKKGIWEYLKTDKRVDSFRPGKYGEGEAGVTIVTLK